MDAIAHLSIAGVFGAPARASPSCRPPTRSPRCCSPRSRRSVSARSFATSSRARRSHCSDRSCALVAGVDRSATTRRHQRHRALGALRDRRRARRRPRCSGRARSCSFAATRGAGAGPRREHASCAARVRGRSWCSSPRSPPRSAGSAFRARTGSAPSRSVTSLVMATSLFVGYVGASTVGATWFGGGVVHGPRTADEVAITFDDGPNPVATPEIMRILDRAHVQGTFFVVGKALDAEPQIVRDLYARRAPCRRTTRTTPIGGASLDPTYPELARTQAAFARNIGTCPVWFRPPDGDKTPMMARVVHRNDMRMAMWDVSGRDSAITDPQKLADHVLENVKKGSIIELHDGLRRRSRRQPRRGRERAAPHSRRLGTTTSAPGAPRPIARWRRVPTVHETHVSRRPGRRTPGCRWTGCVRPVRGRVGRRSRRLPDALHRAVVRQRQQPRSRVVHRARSLASRAFAAPLPVARPRRRVRVSVRARQLDGRRGHVAVVRQLGRHAHALRSVPSGASSRPSLRFPSCGGATGPRPCSRTRR